jgi:large repetitive protein
MGRQMKFYHLAMDWVVRRRVIVNVVVAVAVAVALASAPGQAQAAQAYADWTLNGSTDGSGSFPGVAGMPAFTYTLSGDIESGKTKIRNNGTFDETTWEATYGEGDQEESLDIGTKLRHSVATATLSISFASTVDLADGTWAFAITDLDRVDAVISASLGGTAIADDVIIGWFQGLFDSDPTSSGSPHLPSAFDTTNMAIVAERDDDGVYSDEIVSGGNTESASAWFAPDAAIDTLTFFFQNRRDGSESAHVYMAAAETESAEISVAPTTQAAEDATDGLFTVTASSQLSSDLVVSYTVTGTATSGTDFTALSGSVTLPASTDTVTIPATVTADTIVEGDETIVVTLTGTDNVDATIMASPDDVATVTITDDDTATLAFATTTGTAGEDAGTYAVDVTLTVSGGGTLASDVTVDIADLLTGSATSGGSDYSFTSPTTLTFAAGSGDATQSATVTIVADTVTEGDETVDLDLTTLVDTTGQVTIVAPSGHVLTIEDRGEAGTLASTASVTPGGTVTLTLTDADLDTDAGVAETVQLTTTNSATGESELLTYTETGTNTGVFVATVATTFGTSAGADDDGTFNAQAGDTLDTTYADALTDTGGTATVSASTAVTGGATGTLASTASVTPGGSVTLTLTDADLDTDAGVAETVQLTTTNSATGESELLTYTETGVNTGVFVATVATTFGTSAGADDDGTFNAQAGDTLDTTYADALTATGATSTVSASTTVTGGATGTLAATTSITPGDSATLTLTDADLDTDAGVAETVQLTTTNSATGESELLTYTETGANTGVFVATVATTFGASAGADDDGTFNAQAGDTLDTSYADALAATGGTATASASTTVVGGATGTLSATSSITPGDTVTLTLTDADLDTDAGAADTVQLTTTNSVTGESELLTYTETGVSTGVFAATVATTFGVAAGTDSDGVFSVQDGDTLDTTYADGLTAVGDTATVTASTPVVGGVTGPLAATTSILPGDTVTLAVGDNDLNTDSGAVETLQLTTSNPVTGEAEVLTYTETGADSGVFVATVATTFGTTAGTDNDGTFSVQSGDTLDTSYVDALTDTGGTETFSASVTVAGGTTGSLTATSVVTPGEDITLTLTDADLNTNAWATDTIQLTVTNSVNGESELLTYTETGVNTGVFVATVATAFGTAAGADDDGTFNAQAGDSLDTTYTDALTSTGGTGASSATTTVVGGSTGTLTADASILPGATITLTLTDADLDTDAGAAETAQLTTTNSATGESELLTYTETGANTGVFVASVATTFGASAGADNDGTFNTQAGDTLDTSYADALVDTGATSTVAASTTVMGGATGTLSTTASILPGGSITLTLADADLDVDAGVVETVQVIATNSVTGESELLTYTETGANTGVFVATVATTFGVVAGTDDDGTFNAQAGDTLDTTYTDALTAAGGTATVSASTTVAGGATATLAATAFITPGASVTLTLTDADLDTDTAVAETFQLATTNPATGESESLTYTETGVTTGVFVATVSTTFGSVAGADDDGTFNVQTDDTLDTSYADALTDTGDTATATASTTVTGGATATLAATASIVPGDTVTLTLTDADLDTDTGAAETLQLTTTNSVTGESETLTYTETGVNTGVFVATVSTIFGAVAGTDDDGTFNVQAGDTLDTAYADALTATGATATASASTTVTGGATATLVATASIAPGDPVTLTLTDADLDTDTGVAETVQLTTTNSATGESELLTYTETGVDTGVFVATVATTFGASAGADDDGTFNAQAGDTLDTTYADALTDTGGTATATASTTVAGGATATLVATASITPGASVTLTLTDADLDTDTAVAETFQLATTNSVTGESESLTYTETGVTTGVFVATVATTFGSVAGTDDDGTFNAQAADTLDVSYADALTSDGAAATVTATTTVVGGRTGTLTTEASIIPGGAITLTLTDSDLNTDPAVEEDVFIATVNPVTGESELFAYTETGPDTDIFVATATTTFGVVAGADGDGAFNVQAGDSLQTSYSDVLTDLGGATTTDVTTSVTGGATGSLTAPAAIIPGDSITLTLTDDDLDTDSAVAETVLLTTTNAATGESELLTYAETGVNTGVFVATVSTLFGASAGTDNDGTFNVADGDDLDTTYADALTTTGGPATTSASTVVIGGVTGPLAVTASIVPGDTVTLTVTDDDLNADGGVVEALQLTTMNSVTGESELLTYTESGADTGLFVVTVGTTFGLSAGADDDGAFNVQAGDTLDTTYVDALTDEGGTATFSESSTVVGGATGALAATASIVPGGGVTLTLTDADLATDASVAETVQLTTVNSVTGESELLNYTETGTNTGVFVASVATTFGTTAGADDDGTFSVQADDTLDTTYSDGLAAAGGTASVSASTTVAGGATGTLVATASITPSDLVTLTLTDADLNADAGVAETVQLTTTNSVTGESELLTYTETGADTSVFIATVSTVFGSTAGTDDDGAFSVQAGDTLDTDYPDVLTDIGGAETASTSTTVVGGATGTLTATVSVVPGVTVTITLTDADLDTDASVAQTVQLATTNSTTSESEYLSYTETDTSSGVFVATVATAFGVSAGADDDGTFSVQAGDALLTTAADALTSTGGTGSVSASTSVVGGSSATLTGDSPIVPGDGVTLTLADSDLDTDPAAAETQSLTLTNTVTGETETVVLTETGFNTGVFTGSVGTVYGVTAGTDEDATFIVQAGDALTAAYADALIETGGTSTMTFTSTTLGPAITATKTVDKAEADPGEVLTYTITYQNTGSSDATDVEVLDDLPENVTYVVGSATGTDATATYQHAAGGAFDASDAGVVVAVKWILEGLLAPGETRSVEIQLQVD